MSVAPKIEDLKCPSIAIHFLWDETGNPTLSIHHETCTPIAYGTPTRLAELYTLVCTIIHSY